MTTAGLASLAIIKERLAALDALDRKTGRSIDEAMLGGLGWLTHHFTVDRNPGAKIGWHYYYLYGLERVGSMLGRPHVGTHDWYREGAEVLLGDQLAEGRWPASADALTAEHEDEILQTCFALLFLRRSTVPRRSPSDRSSRATEQAFRALLVHRSP